MVVILYSVLESNPLPPMLKLASCPFQCATDPDRQIQISTTTQGNQVPHFVWECTAFIFPVPHGPSGNES